MCGITAASGVEKRHRTVSKIGSLRTALAYRELLSRLYVIDELPAWTSNRLKRLSLAPKRYLIDASLLASVTGATDRTAGRDGDLLGRLLETFVVAQLRAQVTASEHRCRLYHLRQQHGRRRATPTSTRRSAISCCDSPDAAAASTRQDSGVAADRRSEVDHHLAAPGFRHELLRRSLGVVERPVLRHRPASRSVRRRAERLLRRETPLRPRRARLALVRPGSIGRTNDRAERCLGGAGRNVASPRVLHGAHQGRDQPEWPTPPVRYTLHN